MITGGLTHSRISPDQQSQDLSPSITPGVDRLMDMSSREIRMPLNDVVAVLQDLNEFVVSLDRLGSRQASGAVDEYTVGKFIADWDVARRLAHARRVISVALEAQLSEEDNAEIDALCEQGRFYGTDSAISPFTDQSS